MDINRFCRVLPKIELHAHLNGSLSHSTMLTLMRLQVDSGILDKRNIFVDEFQIGAGDSRNLADCFQVFSIAHSLTSTQEALALATSLTLKEFQDDGCCYIELRSTPKDTPYMNKTEYIDTIVQAMKKSTENLSIVSRLIISIDRRFTPSAADDISNLAIEYHNKYPDVVVGIELSGNPTVGEFYYFVPALRRAKQAGLKVTLHCGEVSNPEEILAMLRFKPERIGHGICIHPKFGGTEETWSMLCKEKIPVEVCLTSNINTKSVPSYEAHHFKELSEAGVPVILCTDDKGVFSTSLSQEYRIAAETFKLTHSNLAQLILESSKCVFDDEQREKLGDMISKFIATGDVEIN